MSLACPVHQETLLAMKRMLAGACRNVLVVVAWWFVHYSLSTCGRHVVVPTQLGPVVRETIQVCTTPVGDQSCV